VTRFRFRFRIVGTTGAIVGVSSSFPRCQAELCVIRQLGGMEVKSGCVLGKLSGKIEQRMRRVRIADKNSVKSQLNFS